MKRDTAGPGDEVDGSGDVRARHGRPHEREREEPQDGFATVPVWMVLGIMVLAMWGGWYLAEHGGGFRADVYDGDTVTAGPATGSSGAEPVAIDPMLLGRRLYNNCLACHQSEGQGVPGQFPPLAGAEWVVGDHRVLVRILLHGMSGPVAVRGNTYDGQMPPWQHLSDRDVAAVSTFIRNSWGNDAEPVTEAQVAAERQATVGRRAPWSATELDALPPANAVPEDG